MRNSSTAGGPSRQHVGGGEEARRRLVRHDDGADGSAARCSEGVECREGREVAHVVTDEAGGARDRRSARPSPCPCRRPPVGAARRTCGPVARAPPIEPRPLMPTRRERGQLGPRPHVQRERQTLVLDADTVGQLVAGGLAITSSTTARHPRCPGASRADRPAPARARRAPPAPGRRAGGAGGSSTGRPG